MFISETSLPVLHSNIKSLSKNFEALQKTYNLTSFKFSIAYFLDGSTWFKDEQVNENSFCQIEGYNLLHQNGNHKNC